MKTFNVYMFIFIIAVLDQTSWGHGVKRNAVATTPMPTDNTELFAAVTSGNLERLQQLVNDGADVNTRDKDGELNRTILHIASAEGKRNIVSFLLARSADVHAKDVEGDEPLAYAAIHGYINIVEDLLNNGANIEEKNIYMYTPLHHAAQWGHEDVVSKLLEKGANIFVKARTKEDSEDRAPYLTPLDVARKYQEAEVVTILERKQREGSRLEYF